MAQKMVTNFRRSLSFTNPPPSKPRPIIHVRSTSLPCRSHPIICQLSDQLVQLSSWDSGGSRTSAWLCDGLSRLKAVHESLDDLLHLPQTRESLRGGACSCLIEKVLEDLLRFVDAFGTFQTLVLSLKDEYSAVQIAARRKDEARIASHAKNLSKIAREIGRLASNLPPIGRSSSIASAGSPPQGEAAEIIGAMNDVIKVTASVSCSVFVGISNSSAFRKQSSAMGLSFGKHGKIAEGIREFHELDLENLRKKAEEEMKMASKKLQEMENCTAEIEGCAEKAFRCLINTRVSLLNVFTQ